MSVVEKPKPVHKQIVGVRQGGIDADPESGWTTFTIAVDGWQHPVKLSTKKTELVDLATAVGKQTATWGYLESDGNPNPHGGFYKNRWLADVTPLGLDQPEAQTPIEELSAAPHPAESADAPPPAVDWDGKELRSHRRACLAIAISSFEGDPMATEEGFTRRAERFVSWVYQQQPEALTSGVPDDDIPWETT